MEQSSRKFYEKTRKKSVYNIQPMGNIPSVIKNGILSYNRSKSFIHHSVAMAEVQRRCERITVQHGLSLHDYASAYFDPRNPMMYKIQREAENLCVLAISSEVLDYKGTIITDGNAASEYTRFYAPEEGIDRLDFVIIYGEWWNSNDPLDKAIKKRMKCAEILVPDMIPYECVVGACVVNGEAKQRLFDQGFDKEIRVAPRVFFRKEGSE